MVDFGAPAVRANKGKPQHRRVLWIKAAGSPRLSSKRPHPRTASPPMPTATPIKYRHYPTAGLRAHLAPPFQQSHTHGGPEGTDAGGQLSLLSQLQGDTSEEVFRLLNSV